MSNTIKKSIAIITTITCAVWMMGPGVVQAVTAEELQAQINDLLATLTALQSQLATLQGGGVAVTGCTITSFDRHLSQGMTGDDVKCLQIVLNSASDTQLAASGVGSPGLETSFFGPLTKGGVVKFQEKYADDVLAYWGLTSGTGYVGDTTITKLNELLAGGAVVPPVECTVNADCSTGYVCTANTCVGEYVPPTSAGLTVGLAADTPASMTIADDANANFTKLTLGAGSDADVSISRIYVTRTGLTSNSSLENIKILDADGVNAGSIGSLNTNSKAMITFAPALIIEAGTSVAYYIRAGIVDGTTGGLTAALGIASADDISAGGATINGTFPVTGNAMTVVQLTIGSVTVSEETTTDSQPDVGDTDVVVLKFKAEAGSTEGVTIEQITLMEVGTAGLDDVENIELYSVTESMSLGTVDSWSARSKASWTNLGISLDKGETYRFKVMVDIIGGSSLTTNADLVDGSDVLMSVKGNTYGFYITPSRSPTTWDGKGVDQTIQTGALTVSKSSATPATGSIAPAADQELAVFDFNAQGEEVKVSALGLTLTLSGFTCTSTAACTEVSNVKVYDENGDIVCGPKDLTYVSTTSATVSFTDTLIVPVGVHQYTVKAKIGSSASSNDTVSVGIADPSSDITAKGMSTNESITPSPTSAVNGNTQTVAAGYLSATTLSSPAARNVAAGVQDFVWMTASLAATASGEDVQVTSIVIEDTVGDAADKADEIDNAEIWADLTSASSDRGDAYETKVSNTLQPDDTDATTTTDETTTFSLTQTITVPKGTFVKIALVADLAAGATALDTHTISIDTDQYDVTAVGADTGTTVDVTPSGAGQTMTVSANGDLTVTVDASSPTADILIGEASQATLAVFKLAANNIEDLDLDNMTITNDGVDSTSTVSVDAVSTFYFYSSSRSDGGSTSTPIGIATGGATATVVFADGTVTIPADDNVKITVKGDLANVDGTQVQNQDGIEITIDDSTGDIDTTGLASGAEIDSDDTVDAATHVLYESRPTFALNSASPSGDLIPSQAELLAIFDITADAAEDITFESGDSNFLIVQLTTTIATALGGADDDFVLKDQDGTSLDTVTANIDTATTITFDFTDASLTIPAGQTKKVYVYGETTELAGDGDVIQLWLDDGNSGNNVDWGIEGSGSYNEGDKIFRGDIYGGTFVNPS